MDYFRSTFFKLCREHYSKYGFKRKGQVYVRVNKEIIQKFELFRSMSGRWCRIYFSFAPLCYPIEFHTKQKIPMLPRTFELRNLEGKLFDEWGYDRTEESMNLCIKEIIKYMDDNLIPFFEKVDSCETALSEFKRIDELCDFPGKGVNYLNAIMLLKIGKYNMAYEILPKLGRPMFEAYRHNREYGVEYSFERLKEFFDELVHYDLVMKMIENNDIESINEMLRKNEENCINNLGNLLKQ